MAVPPSGWSATNRLLQCLPAAVLDRLRPDFETVALSRGEVIYRVDDPVAVVYFVEQGLISLIKTMQDGRTVEIGAVGIEGLTAPNTLFGIETAILESIVQLPGKALRMRSDVLRREIATCEPVRDVLQRYARFSVIALAQTAACNRLHTIEERCCRWLLIAHDSAGSDTFPLTHEFLAMMLGAQRSGVSLTAKILQRAGLISYRRGQVTVTDRSGLESAACECYATNRTEIERLFPVAAKI